MINILTIYSKFLLARLDKVSSINLAINLKSLIVLLTINNRFYLYFLYIIARAGYY